MSNFRLKPKLASDFSYLRSDGYYPDYVSYHKQLCEKQDTAFKNKDSIQVIECINEKFKNIDTYIGRARSNLSNTDFDLIDRIIKNDSRMLKYLQCEKILEPQNEHLRAERNTYRKSIQTYENIKTLIADYKNPSPRPRPDHSDHSIRHEHEIKPNNDRGFDFDF